MYCIELQIVLATSYAIHIRIQLLFQCTGCKMLRNTQMQSMLQDLLCGTISGAGNCLSGYIFDTVKVRMQMDPKLHMGDILRQAVRKQGISQLFDGIRYPLLSVPAVNAIVFATYEMYKKVRGKEELSFTDGIENGAVTGLVNTIVVSPVELIKCKMQTDYSRKWVNSRQCLKDVIRKEGINGLFKGGFSTALREIFAYAAQFAVYEYLKDKIVGRSGKHLGVFEGMFVGMAAGINCWIFSYPQDVIKTRLQLAKAAQYPTGLLIPDGGFFICANTILQERGIAGLFDGIKPCLIRAAIANAIGIALYEQFQAFFSADSDQKLETIIHH